MPKTFQLHGKYKAQIRKSEHGWQPFTNFCTYVCLCVLNSILSIKLTAESEKLIIKTMENIFLIFWKVTSSFDVYHLKH